MKGALAFLGFFGSVRSVALVLCQGVFEHIAWGAFGLGRSFGRSSQDFDKKSRKFLGSVLVDPGIDLFGVNALSSGFIGPHFAIEEPMVLPFGKGFVSLSTEVFANIVFDAIAQAIGILVFDHQGVSFSHAPC